MNVLSESLWTQVWLGIPGDPGAQIRKGNKGSEPREAHGHQDAAPAVRAVPAGRSDQSDPCLASCSQRGRDPTSCTARTWTGVKAVTSEVVSGGRGLMGTEGPSLRCVPALAP